MVGWVQFLQFPSSVYRSTAEEQRIVLIELIHLQYFTLVAACMMRYRTSRVNAFSKLNNLTISKLFQFNVGKKFAASPNDYSTWGRSAAYRQRRTKPLYNIQIDENRLPVSWLLELQFNLVSLMFSLNF